MCEFSSEIRTSQVTRHTLLSCPDYSKMAENPEQLRSCLKAEIAAELPGNAIVTPKRVCFAMLDEIKEYTPPFTDDSTNSIDSPLTQQKPKDLAKVPAASPLYSSPFSKSCVFDDCKLSPATEIDIETLLEPACPVPPNTSELSAPWQESNVSITNEPGIEDITAGNLNETSDDFVCSLMHSVDMSMTFSSDDFQKCSSENTKSPAIITPSSLPICSQAKLELFTPDLCTGSTPKTSSSLIQKSAPIPRDGVWKKFRILSPFSIKSRPTIEIRSVDVRGDYKASQAIGLSLNPEERSAQRFSGAATRSYDTSGTATLISMEDKTLPFTSDDENDQSDQVPEPSKAPNRETKSRTEPSKEPEGLRSIIQTSKSWRAPFKNMTKDPLKIVKDLKISKVALKKAKKGPQKRKPHLGIASLVERLRNASLEDDYFCQDSSPERPIKQADLSPERYDLYDPSSTNQTPQQHVKAKSRSRSKIPLPVSRTAVEQSYHHKARTQSSGELNEKSGLSRPRRHENNEAIVIVNRTSSIKSDPKAAINRLIKEVKVLHGVEKVRKLDSLAKLYLRRANDDTFYWAISKLTGYAHQDFIKAEEQFRDIQRLIRNPAINSDEGAKDSKRIFAAVKMDAMNRRLHSLD